MRAGRGGGETLFYRRYRYLSIKARRCGGVQGRVDVCRGEENHLEKKEEYSSEKIKDYKGDKMQSTDSPQSRHGPRKVQAQQRLAGIVFPLLINGSSVSAI